MQAITYNRYGAPSVLTPSQVPAPTPAPTEVRIRIHAAVVSSADAAFRSGTPWFARLFTGLAKPKLQTLGTEFAGTIESTGSATSRFRTGDHVFAASGTDLGAHAELICLAEDAAICPAPTGTDFDHAAAICEGALTALPFLRDWAKLQPGQSILINGASGSVGTSAIQLAKHLGATVTAVCSAANAQLVKSLGADRVIDYHSVDFTSEGRTYDVIFDAVATSSFSRCKASLNPGGTYLATVPSFGILTASLTTRCFGSKRAKIGFAGLRSAAEKTADLAFVKRLTEAGELRAVVDSTFDFDQAPAAHARVDSKRKRGSVVLRMPA